MSKIIFDPIHKYMEFNKTLIKIIDTVEFQRLRQIKQLGACHFVFPGATHTRFEHSLGVCHLCGLLIKRFQINQPELEITDRQVLLVQIAGLLHDIGHACYSHLFDHKFLKVKTKYKDHEYRSCMLVERIIKRYRFDFNDQEIKFIQNLIDPKIDNKGFIYQIVANKKNGLDCDKFDYLSRDTYNIGLNYSIDFSRLIKYAKVIDNEICFPKKCYSDILDLYYTRYKLFKQVYTHPVVRGIEFTLLNILNSDTDLVNNIDSYLENLSKFLVLTDNYIYSIQNASDIIYNLNSRKFYKLIKEVQSLKDFDIPHKLKDKIIIDEINLNYSKNNKNPLEFVKFYKDDKIIQNNFYGILPNRFEETIYRIYYKKIGLPNK